MSHDIFFAQAYKQPGLALHIDFVMPQQVFNGPHDLTVYVPLVDVGPFGDSPCESNGTIGIVFAFVFTLLFNVGLLGCAAAAACRRLCNGHLRPLARGPLGPSPPPTTTVRPPRATPAG